MLEYAPFGVAVVTPRLELRATTDGRLAQLAPLVRAGLADADPPPFDDPISLYESDPDLRVGAWLRAVWRGRGALNPEHWRLSFTVIADGDAVGVQDLIGDDFATYGTVVTFGWLSAECRGRGVGREMREAVLHLAFDGLGAREAASDAFVDNVGSNGVSAALGYERNGVDRATRRGDPANLQRWRLTRDCWSHRRRNDIDLIGVPDCRRELGIDRRPL